MPNEYLRPSEMKEQQQTIANISGSCHTLLTHLGGIPASDASLHQKQAWFELLCELLGAHHLALGAIQQVVAQYGSLGFGYVLTETLSSSEGMEQP